MTEFAEVKLAENIPGLGLQGQTVRLALTPADVHVTEELATYLAGYRPFTLRAPEVSKAIIVPNDFDTYRTFSADNAFLPVQVKGSLTGDIPLVDPQSTTATFTAQHRYCGSLVSRITEQQSKFNVRQASTKRCVKALALDLEIDVWTMLVATANWASSSYYTTLVAGQCWDEAGGNPIKDLMARISASAQLVNGIWMNYDSASAMLQNTNVKDWLAAIGSKDIVTKTLVELGATGEDENYDFKLPLLPRIHVVMGKYSATPGATPSSILGDDVVLTTSPPGEPTDGEDIATTYTFRRAGIAGVGYDIREVPIETRGPSGATLCIVSTSDKPVMTGTSCGGLIKNTIK